MTSSTKSIAARKRQESKDLSAEPLRSGLRQFTRQRILDAAMRAFRMKGYQATTVEGIVELAGTTVPTFYRHFSNKKELLGPLLDHLNEEVGCTLRELDALDVLDHKNIRRWLDSYMVMWARLHKLCEAHWEAANLDRAYAENLLDDAIQCVSGMSRIVARMPDQQKGRFKLRMGLLTMCLDRMALAVSLEHDGSRASDILDEFANLICFILNDGSSSNK